MTGSEPTVIDMYASSDLQNGKEAIGLESDRDTNLLLREGNSNHRSHPTNGDVANYPGSCL